MAIKRGCLDTVHHGFSRNYTEIILGYYSNRDIPCLSVVIYSSEYRQPLFYSLAGGPGFEPGFTESESVVLPLNDPPIFVLLYRNSDDASTAFVPGI